MKARTEGYKNNNYWSGGVKYAFSSKIYCKNDNTNFQRSHGSRRKNRPTWSCGMYLQYRIKECCSPIIPEVDLYDMFKNIMNSIIPNKDIIVNDLLNMYENLDKVNLYEKDLNAIETKITKVEEKKSLALDLVLKGEIKRSDLKVQFEEFEQELSTLTKRKNEILNQIDVLNNSHDNLSKMSKLIQEEINGGSIDEFIRKFVDEIIVSKINDDRYNIKLDIFLNLLGVEKSKTKGARHIDGPKDDEVLYMENVECNTIEIKRSIDHQNKYTYNVYVEAL